MFRRFSTNDSLAKLLTVNHGLTLKISDKVFLSVFFFFFFFFVVVFFVLFFVAVFWGVLAINMFHRRPYGPSSRRN